MLRVPVVSAVGHERDTTLIDDVAAVACSTPTHAAEAAVPLDCREARALADPLRRLARARRPRRRRRAGAPPRRLARGPARALQRERGALNQRTREIRAAAERGVRDRGEHQRRIALVVLRRAARRALEGTQQAGADIRRRGRGLERSAQTALRQRREALERTRVALRAHDPRADAGARLRPRRERGRRAGDERRGGAARPSACGYASPTARVTASIEEGEGGDG